MSATTPLSSGAPGPIAFAEVLADRRVYVEFIAPEQLSDVEYRSWPRVWVRPGREAWIEVDFKGRFRAKQLAGLLALAGERGIKAMDATRVLLENDGGSSGTDRPGQQARKTLVETLREVGAGELFLQGGGGEAGGQEDPWVLRACTSDVTLAVAATERRDWELARALTHGTNGVLVDFRLRGRRKLFTAPLRSRVAFETDDVGRPLLPDRVRRALGKVVRRVRAHPPRAALAGPPPVVAELEVPKGTTGRVFDEDGVEILTPEVVLEEQDLRPPHDERRYEAAPRTRRLRLGLPDDDASLGLELSTLGGIAATTRVPRPRVVVTLAVLCVGAVLLLGLTHTFGRRTAVATAGTQREIPAPRATGAAVFAYPTPGLAVTYPATGVRGVLRRSIGRRALWLVQRGVDGERRYHPAEHACAVRGRRWTCDDLYLGRDREHGREFFVVLLAADSAEQRKLRRAGTSQGLETVAVPDRGVPPPLAVIRVARR